eukprot:5036297-Alexandrium_andersonii.AAC.1
MSASLVGSEMCIRDRNTKTPFANQGPLKAASSDFWRNQSAGKRREALDSCLLYTSDAADDM